MPNFADCVVRIVEPRLGKECLNPTKQIVQDVLNRGAFPRFTGPLSRTEKAAIKKREFGSVVGGLDTII